MDLPGAVLPRQQFLDGPKSERLLSIRSSRASGISRYEVLLIVDRRSIARLSLDVLRYRTAGKRYHSAGRSVGRSVGQSVVCRSVSWSVGLSVPRLVGNDLSGRHIFHGR